MREGLDYATASPSRHVRVYASTSRPSGSQPTNESRGNMDVRGRQHEGRVDWILSLHALLHCMQTDLVPVDNGVDAAARELGANHRRAELPGGSAC